MCLPFCIVKCNVTLVQSLVINFPHAQRCNFQLRRLDWSSKLSSSVHQKIPSEWIVILTGLSIEY